MKKYFKRFINYENLIMVKKYNILTFTYLYDQRILFLPLWVGSEGSAEL
jgi:5'(3')-deoxyribonucleotidase